MTWEYDSLDNGEISLEEFLKQHKGDLKLLKIDKISRRVFDITAGRQKSWTPLVIVASSVNFQSFMSCNGDYECSYDFFSWISQLENNQKKLISVNVIETKNVESNEEEI